MRQKLLYCLMAMGTALAERAPDVDGLPLEVAPPEPPVIGATADQPPQAAAERSRARVLDAALSLVGHYGVSKTTLDDIARAARLSRATIYRLFPGGRDELLGALLDQEVSRFFSALRSRLDDAVSAEERAVAFLVSVGEQLVHHEALGGLLAREPELVLPEVAFGRFDRVLAMCADVLEPYFRPWLEREDARRVGEWLVRLALSYVAWPSPQLELAGTSPVRPDITVRLAPIPEERARRLVSQFVLPGISVLMTAPTARVVPDRDAVSTT